ncbi:hypothetical protein ACH4FE_20805 [Streptomyces celluloflavus]|uniref:hypothetical protein n=1 Tax=Streptomyces celluloflavus TaxID=58344 RepID=UPI0037A822CB
MPRRSRPARRATLVVHIAVFVGWFGLTLGLLIPRAARPEHQRLHHPRSPKMAAVAYRAMKVFGDRLVLRSPSPWCR